MNYVTVLTGKEHRGMYVPMDESQDNTQNRIVVVNTLATVGFIALIGASMWLAVYSTRFVPGVVGRIGSAAVYLGSVFTPAPASLSVVPTPTASSTILTFGEATSTTGVATTTKPATQTPAKPKTVPTTAGEQTSTTQQIGGTATPAALTGLPDLIVTINAVGYLATTSAESFITSSIVPAGSRPAVNFTIKNIGTNVSGMWRFSATIPTQSAYLYQSQPQQSLNPGDSIDYTLGFDQANRGTGQTISITANYDRGVTESNTDNNNASAKITILGS